MLNIFNMALICTSTNFTLATTDCQGTLEADSLKQIITTNIPTQVYTEYLFSENDYK